MSDFDPSQIEWREPWGPVSPEYGAHAQRELHREMPGGHVLARQLVVVVGARCDRDDVLFYLEETGQFAVVHLSYNSERDPKFPHTTLFNSLAEWVDQRMTPDAVEYDT